MDYCDSDDDYNTDVENNTDIESNDDSDEPFFNHSINKNYTVLNVAEIRRRQDDDISHICTVLSLSKPHAMVLLSHYNWKISKLHDEWFVDEQAVCNAIGLFDNNNNNNNDNNNNNNNSCGVCFDEFDKVDMRSVSCGHTFCVTCWKGYISSAINDSGAGCLSLRCPEYKCRAAVTKDLIEELASKEENEKYDGYFVKSYVECKRENTKWCPTPDCECAVELELDDDGGHGYDVSCLCSRRFCWNCGEEAHRPVDCELVAKWVAKNSSEAENTKWILAYSKPCPKCHRPIEKNHGCNHMTCALGCKYEFCWLCLEDWMGHHESYSCNSFNNKPNSSEKKKDEQIRKHAKKTLERYTHYYERWASNHKSRQKAIDDLIRVESIDLKIVSDRFKTPVTQLEFITTGWKQIIECRRVLKWSYTYGYYLLEHEPVKKQFFEYSQGEAEHYLEKLHGCAEIEFSSLLDMEKPQDQLDFDEYHSKLVQLTKVTGKYFEHLVRALENGLSEVDVGESSSTINEKMRKKLTPDESPSSTLVNVDYWNCDQCTYMNPLSATSCQMCSER
ncbi:probable E3 ubiquitin-protein ligase ARI8 [Beta vulgaris subsp. vulgaris]|uniref:probable E3 ubiquitin-protein ligase ARI8 n=1 Tax=Beta vulgaris subsp. vulgaris TaxID=3555 RepID=UPI002547204E|nr:probable E3 ubiquitin-protein ligase ARI8 [Beta vulgaris subsp. vulgaris]